MAATTDAMYDARGRVIEYKVEMFLNGTGALPLVVTRDNYLLSASTLEEIGLQDSKPTPVLAYNEFDLSLYNNNELFTPTNSASPYYGKIKAGVKLIPYIRVVSTPVADWDKMGEYYVMDWNIPDASNPQIDITSYDQAYTVSEDSSTATVEICYGDVVTFLHKLCPNTSFAFPQTLTDIPYLYPLETRRTTLEMIAGAQRGFLAGARSGVLQLGRLPFNATPHELRDDNQIISLSVPQTSIRQYDDVTLQYFLHARQTQQEILSLRGITLPAGITTYTKLLLEKSPLIALESLCISGAPYFSFSEVQGYANSITFKINNMGQIGTAELYMNGTILNKTQAEIAGNGRTVTVSNNFVQTAALADAYQCFLSTFTKSYPQIISASIRGNPRIQLGDSVYVNSARYKIALNGVVIGCRNEYNGGLTTTLEILNATALGGIR